MILQDGVARLLAILIHEGRLADQVELKNFAIATFVRFVTPACLRLQVQSPKKWFAKHI